MIFNSIEFLIFLFTIFFLYWFCSGKNNSIQNSFIIFASYFFYGCWDVRFLGLIIISTIVDFGVSIGIYNIKKAQIKRYLLWTSIFVNIGILGIFKYYNFFIDNFILMLSAVNIQVDSVSLNVILPVGISFYTFQTLSYSIDVYKGKIHPTKNFLAFSAFVSFFPQLVAGPIERASNLLPQFLKKREFDYNKAIDGLRQILWGLFKKIVIADNCAIYANEIFSNYTNYSGSTLFLGGFFFAFQIYGDFSGYSDIAIGTSRLFGFSLKKNFSFPYFSRDIAEFWRRWHISLSTWFRDYLYIPLGGSQFNKFKTIRNVFITFIVSGLWHGANWTFIVWGAVNAIYFLPLLIFNKNRAHIEIVAKGSLFPSLKEMFQIIITFSITTIAWIFFRSETIFQAFNYIDQMLFHSFFSIPNISTQSTTTLFLVIFFVIIEWLGREGSFGISNIHKVPTVLRWGFYYILILLMFIFTTKAQPFIYFQF
ncbi:membrane-bound O-acyltransferase family protein [Candidatus Marinamargulisbacteria bacterium SCGC AG-414-C22]|nr:membrane-bound O-acyltransferase family protein [Candidatus Marinamargulisbacteria bacterium SCGC AG-414-C22]